jgi:cytosine/adenosine deaminase-related metal-dependent hydrolase
VTEVYAADHVVPVGAPPLRGGAVAVADGAIVAVGTRAEVLNAYPEARVEELGSAILLPALVNAHTHLEYATYGGFGDGMTFGPWIADHVARRPRLEPGDVEAAAALGALQNLRSGVGTIADASFAGASVRAASEAGLRGIVDFEAFGGKGQDPAPTVERTWERVQALRAEASPLIRVGISPHAPYTVTPALYRALDELALAEGLSIITHVAESKGELEAIASGTGPVAVALLALAEVEASGLHPVDLMAELGLLRPDVVLVHMVQITPEHARLVAAGGAGVAHCPRSNALLGCGAAPLADLLAAGARVGIGTDSPASAVDFDLWAELRTAIYTARAREARPDALSAQQALELATIGGARALGCEDTIGTLAVGKRADLTAIDLTGSPFAEVEDPIASAVFAGSPERTLLTIIDGVVRYRRATDDGRLAAALAAARPGRARMIGHEN